LELIKALVWIGDYVGGALENVIVDRFYNRALDFGQPCGLLLKQRCDE